jgi:hypothetical protein
MVADEAGERLFKGPPKEQPPRNLSGKRTASAFATLWKEPYEAAEGVKLSGIRDRGGSRLGVNRRQLLRLLNGLI